MGRRKSFYAANRPHLENLCDKLGFIYEYKDPYEHQMRIYGATHVIDIWPSRMVYHRIQGEDIVAVEHYRHDIDQQFNRKQVTRLLETGKV